MQFYCEMDDKQIHNSRILFKLTATLVVVITFIFYGGYVYHFSQMVKEHDKYFKNRINPAAFTVKTKLTNELWEKCLESYESEQVLARKGIS